MSTISIRICLAAATAAAAAAQDGAPPEGWLDWRGPLQSGVSPETGLPDALDVEGEALLWTFDVRGRGTPVIADGRLYAMAYDDGGPDLVEMVTCLDAATGELVWSDRWADYLTDVVYDRYAIGSPTVDPRTGDVFALSTAGLLKRYSADGRLVWEVSTMEELGRLTFPNGRTGAPVVDGDLVLVHVINAHWGPVEGPARDRFYAFDKETGDVVWGCTPGVEPKDSSFSHPVLEDRGGRRVLYAGTGCGNMVAIDARTGDALWRFQMSIGGVNSSALLYGDHLIAIHGMENVDTSTIGRMISLQLGTVPEPGAPGPVVLPAGAEAWRNDLDAFTSSPVLAEDRVYVTVTTGELCCVNAGTGEVLWRHKLAPDQIHASPVWADGKLYVPMTNGTLHVVRPTDEGPEVLSSTQLEGSCLGAPAVSGGRIYVHTTEKLYCFGGEEKSAPAWPVAAAAEPSAPARLQVVPADVVLVEGESAEFRLRTLDASGVPVAWHGDPEESAPAWQVPPILGEPRADGLAVAMPAARTGVGVLVATLGDWKASARVRVVPRIPWSEDFEAATLDKPGSDGAKVAFPPTSWIGAFKKWEVVEHEGGKVLRKTLDNPLFQRSMGFCGHPDMAGYTTRIDVMTDGNRRSMSSAGVVNQRYLIQLKGNHQELEISSNVEQLKETAPFRIQPGAWYTLVARVDVAPDGSGVVRAKAWPRDEAEPDAWTLEVEHATAHTNGAPGLFGFTPQSRFHVYVDNFSVTSDE